MTPASVSASVIEYGPWCTKCGYTATVIRETLDSKRPIGLCRRGYPSHRGCGEVIASWDLDEADSAYRKRRRRLTESRHRQHPNDNPGKWANWCRACELAQQLRSHTE